MSDRTRTITIDEETAAAIEQRAAQLGLTAAQLLADAFSPAGPEASEAALVTDLDERWQRTERGGQTIPHDQVVRWLQTWGRPDFEPWDADR